MMMRPEPQSIVATYEMMKDRWGDWWIGVKVNGAPHDKLGPFRTRDECNAAYRDLLDMVRSVGGVDQPKGGH